MSKGKLLLLLEIGHLLHTPHSVELHHPLGKKSSVPLVTHSIRVIANLTALLLELLNEHLLGVVVADVAVSHIAPSSCKQFSHLFILSNYL
jgi:hypothetical protein